MKALVAFLLFAALLAANTMLVRSISFVKQSREEEPRKEDDNHDHKPG